MWIMVNKIRKDIREDRDRRNRDTELQMLNLADDQTCTAFIDD